MRRRAATIGEGQHLDHPGAATLDGSANGHGAGLAYRRLGRVWLRVDLADRLATFAHGARAAGNPDPVDAALVTSLGLNPDTVRLLRAEIGFVPAGEAWKWRGTHRRHVAPRTAPARPGNAFAALAGLKK